ncbi:MAG: EAL domain-containing protein [Gammaproteobacteria bacterium]|nr:EAL domain-containing protein [Gammaproteobacteria bacterium]
MRLKQLITTSRSKVIIYLSLILVIGALTLILVNSALVLNTSRKRIENVVFNHQHKARLLSELRSIANARTTSIQKMLLLSDPIAVNEEMVHFNDLVGKYSRTWLELTRLPFDAEEKSLLDQQRSLIQRNGLRQTEISKLIYQQDFDAAKQLLLKKVLPVQSQVYDLTEQLSRLQDSASRNAVAESQKIYNRIMFFIIALAVMIYVVLIGVASRVTKRLQKTENDIHYEKERSFTVLDSIADAVITTDAKGNIDQLNKAAHQLLGIRTTTAIHKPLEKYLSFKTRLTDNLQANPARQVIDNGEAIRLHDDTYLIIRENEEIAIELSAAPMYDRDHGISGAVLVIKDISEMRALTNELAHQARHDSLTGLLNRREFENRLEQTINEVRRYQDEQAWFCYLDLDQFKIINDTCGHLAGDELLKQIAFKLIHTTREVDHIGRMGGDEFTIILKRCDKATAGKIMERIRKELHDMRFCWDNKCFTITISIGIVEITPQCGNVYDVLKAADTACYIAKEEGRNRIHMFDEDDKVYSQRQGEMEWVHRIYRAIEAGQFVLFYQEIKHLKKDEQELHGELLIRMLDDDGNIVAPYIFIPAAERYNLMSEVDRHIVRLALNTISRYYDNQLVRNGLFSINLSAQSLSDDDFLSFILLQLANTSVQPSNICFEITETAAISNLVKATTFIMTLKEKGCYFALDDFGSGLSSFAYLKNLPVDFIKIDGGFVKTMLSSSLDHALVSSVNQIGHVVGMKTIAEFVENSKIEKRLREIGIDYAQGYGIARPEPFNSMLDKVVSRGTKSGIA